MDACINVHGLVHEYLTYEKSEGLIGTIRDFFGRRTVRCLALDQVDLRVRYGEMVGLLGPNGAGKTTLMKVISGLIHPTAGKVQVMGYYPYEKRKEFLRHLGLVLGQKSQLMWDLPASDTLRMLKEIYGVSEHDYRSRLESLVDSLNVGHRLSTPVRKLSLGERMKFELIAALLHQPRLLLLDEPTIGLDISSQRSIHAFLREVNRRWGTTIIVTSHYAKDIEALADRVVILRQGRVSYDGPIRDLLVSRQDTLLLRIETDADLSHGPLQFRPVGENRWECEVLPSELNRTLLTLAKEVPIRSITTLDKPLEDVLYALFNDGGQKED